MAIEIPRSRLPADLIVTDDCERMVRHFEGFRPVAYKDPVGIWTIGYGFTENVKPGDTISMVDANERLRAELEEHAQIVRDAIPDVPLSQGQFNALTSYVYNIGRILETLLAKLKTRDYAGALAEFPRACRAEGRPFKGLYRRRLAEACLWAGLNWEGATAPHLIQLTADSAGNIDFSRTTTLEQTLARARQDVATTEIRQQFPSAPPIIPSAPTSKPPFDPQFPRTEVKPVPAPEPILTIETPAGAVLPPATVEEVPAIQPPSPPGPPTITETTAEQPVRAGSADGAAGVSPSLEHPAVPPLVLTTPAPSAPPSAPPAPKPLPPKPPAPAVTIGQQTSAVNASKNSEDWSHGAKSMLLSRRFWGLALVMFGRLWMMKTGSGALLAGVSDPLVTEMFSGFGVMIAGEAISWWGRAKATRPLK